MTQLLLKLFQPTFKYHVFLICSLVSVAIDYSLNKSCTEIKKYIDNAVQRILLDLNYIGTKHSLTFICRASDCKGGHPAKMLLSEGNPSTLLCTIVEKRFSLPANSHFWGFGCASAQQIHKTGQCFTILSDQHHSVLLKQLHKHAAKWKTIGSHLGFLPNELANIEARPLLLHNAPESWLSAMLAEWLQWAPGDHRSWTTLEALKHALREAGLGVTASDIGI